MRDETLGYGDVMAEGSGVGVGVGVLRVGLSLL